MINIGIIGCGQWGTNHVRVFCSSGAANVMACCDKNADRLRSLDSAYPGLITTADAGRIIHDRAIDAVVIAVPTAAHYKLARAALTAGKHLLCEKPLAIRPEETGRLVRLAKKNKKILMTGYVFLFNNGITALKKHIDKDELGKVLYLHFTRTNLGPIRNDVDVIYDLASHDIAIASFLLGGWPEGVSASAGFFLRKNISDTAFITLHYPKNRLVNIHVSWLDPKKIRTLTCVGDKKMAVWDDLDATEPIKIFNKRVIREPFYSDYGEFQLLSKEGEVTSPSVKLSEPLKNQDIHFLDCINKGKAPLTGGIFAHNVTRVLAAIELSMKNRGSIEKTGIRKG